jgi:DNA helicase HerA-like ATPase
LKNKILKEFPRQVILDRCDEYPNATVLNSAADVLDYITARKVYKCKVVDLNYTMVDQLSFVCFAIGRLCMVVEEASVWFPARSQLTPPCEDIIFRGRHKALSIIFVAQRASQINVNIRSQFSDLFIFNQSEPKDIKWINQASGTDIRDFHLLQTGEYYHITPKSIDKVLPQY